MDRLDGRTPDDEIDPAIPWIESRWMCGPIQLVWITVIGRRVSSAELQFPEDTLRMEEHSKDPRKPSDAVNTAHVTVLHS